MSVFDRSRCTDMPAFLVMNEDSFVWDEDGLANFKIIGLSYMLEKVPTPGTDEVPWLLWRKYEIRGKDHPVPVAWLDDESDMPDLHEHFHLVMRAGCGDGKAKAQLLQDQQHAASLYAGYVAENGQMS